jgi:hypothetical protein
MVDRRFWEAYKPIYRAREMKILAGWIQAGESGSIMGLAGSGKSNLLGFLSHRPEVMAQYLRDRSLKLALVQVDLNNLPGNDLATFYRVILRSLYEARAQLAAIEDSLPDTVETLYRKVEEKTDPFLSQSALREVLLLFRKERARLVLVLDPFDQFCRTASTQILNNLRGLRDSFKITLSYLVGLRQELAYIRDPVELEELYEILDIHLCWLGPMEKDDTRWVISQVEEGAGTSFKEDHIEHLIDLTGGYPALLRAASMWLAKVSPVPDMNAWQEQLLAEPGIQNRLEDLWRGLTGEEEAALYALQKALAIESDRKRGQSLKQIEEKHGNALNCLQAKYLCLQTDAGWRFFSPLFAKFVAKMEGISAGRIWHASETDRFFQGETELTGLSEKDRQLLRHFLDHPVIAHTIDDLVEAAWEEWAQHDDWKYDWMGAKEAVSQAIRHLRKQIELNPSRPRYIITERQVGYRFFPEGAPRG